MRARVRRLKALDEMSDCDAVTEGTGDELLRPEAEEALPLS